MMPSQKLHTIYAIRCKENGKLYIGRTTRLEERIKIHFTELRNGRHKIKTLQDDFKKYGAENFEVYVLEENIPYSERMKEYEYMRKYNSFDEKFGYNNGDRRKGNIKKVNYIYELPPNNYEKNK